MYKYSLIFVQRGFLLGGSIPSFDVGLVKINIPTQNMKHTVPACIPSDRSVSYIIGLCMFSMHGYHFALEQTVVVTIRPDVCCKIQS